MLSVLLLEDFYYVKFSKMEKVGYIEYKIC